MVTIDLPAGLHGEYEAPENIGTHELVDEAVEIYFGEHRIARVYPRFPPVVTRITPGEFQEGYSYTDAEEKEIVEFTIAKVFADLLAEYNTHD